jgi:hypothetical protein
MLSNFGQIAPKLRILFDRSYEDELVNHKPNLQLYGNLESSTSGSGHIGCRWKYQQTVFLSGFIRNLKEVIDFCKRIQTLV